MLGNLLVLTTMAFAYAYIFYTIKDKVAPPVFFVIQTIFVNSDSCRFGC